METTINNQLEHYSEKFNKVIEELNRGIKLRYVAKSVEFNLDDIEKEAKECSQKFKDLAYVFSKNIKGGTGFLNFAAAVTFICREYNIEHEVYAGFALDKNSEDYVEKKNAEARPITYIYVKVAGNDCLLSDSMDLIDMHKLEVTKND